MTNCKRCGQCCYFLKDGKLTKCKYLILSPMGKSLCRIYRNRLNVAVSKDPATGEKIYCVLRAQDTRKFIDCPLNNNI